MLTFTELGVPAALTQALAGLGITTPFPIQAATLPDTLAGRDVLGRGRTGSGKTYAFALPVLARLAAAGKPRRPGRPRALILAPTRELAAQIDAALAPLAATLGLRTLVVFGGVGATPQIRGLAAGVDVLVACPGRLDDHLRNGHVSLDAVEVTVLDEADHMADLGFLPVVRRLMEQTPRTGQRLLFSATLDNGVDVLVKRFLHRPVTHAVDAAAEAPVEMSHHVLHVRGDDRFPVLVDLLAAPGRTVVFTRTKRRAKVLARQLVAAGVPAVELHGNLAQNARNRNLAAFSDGSAETLVATDIAARGIHVDDVALVIHADPPVEHKAYLHRSGRTARAGAQGTVITLMTDDQQAEVRDLTRKAGVRPTTTRTRPGDAHLAQLAPGERRFIQPEAPQPRTTTQPTRQPRPASQPTRDSRATAQQARDARATTQQARDSRMASQPTRESRAITQARDSRAASHLGSALQPGTADRSSTADRPKQPSRRSRGRGRGAAHASPAHASPAHAAPGHPAETAVVTARPASSGSSGRGRRGSSAQARSDQARSDQARTGQARTGQARTGQARTGQARTTGQTRTGSTQATGGGSGSAATFSASSRLGGRRSGR